MTDRIGPVLLAEAHELGAEELRVIQGGKHPRLVGRIGERDFVYAFPATPSDWRSALNARAALRRLLGGSKEPRPKQLTPAPKAPRRHRKVRRRSETLELLPGRSTAPADAGEDRFHAPLEALRAEMLSAAEAYSGLGESTAPDKPVPVLSVPERTRSIRLRTPWLGRRARFQAG
jgi:hypothetical protein